ncbi:uncharacterized protein LOC131928246 isoform X1 [Physella acuta]|uniref:uncharacterized protein LOC131928246 isoform X1 n=1 Tax=Physella acuta TaxID=109671 RepID=UPI0027DD1C84|nr:uncharacterized protein LOC131928246 isoform X1 [Physella acuta]
MSVKKVKDLINMASKRMENCFYLLQEIKQEMSINMSACINELHKVFQNIEKMCDNFEKRLKEAEQNYLAEVQVERENYKSQYRSLQQIIQQIQIKKGNLDIQLETFQNFFLIINTLSQKNVGKPVEKTNTEALSNNMECSTISGNLPELVSSQTAFISNTDERQSVFNWLENLEKKPSVVSDIEQSSPQTSLLCDIEQSSPQTSLLCDIEQSSPQTSLLCDIEQSSPQTSLLSDIEQSSPQTSLLCDIEQSSPQTLLLSDNAPSSVQPCVFSGKNQPKSHLKQSRSSHIHLKPLVLTKCTRSQTHLQHPVLRKRISSPYTKHPIPKSKQRPVKSAKLCKRQLPPGWKVKLVQRSSGVSAGKYDVYYYSPENIKVRSKKELLSYYKGPKEHLDLFEFSVSKLIKQGMVNEK